MKSKIEKTLSPLSVNLTRTMSLPPNHAINLLLEKYYLKNIPSY